MERFSPLLRVAMLAVVLASASSVEATNRFRVVGGSYALSSADNVVVVEADLDQDIYGFSVSIDFDADKIRVSEVRAGADVVPLDPEYSAGTIDNTDGELVHGVVFALSAAKIDVKLNAGASRRILELVVDVLATQEGSTVVDLINVSGTPGRRNVMTDENGDSVSPDPSLADGTLNFTEIGPVIEDVFPTSGEAGTQILLSGRNFDGGGLVVRVCGQEVAAEVLGVGGQTLQFLVPNCGGGSRPIEIEVCTNLGCASDPQAFDYVASTEGTPFLRGDTNNDGRLDLSDGVAVFSDLFLGIPTRAPCRDAVDANDSGLVDLSDGVFILNFLFQGGPRPPEPYPNPGLDPTPDGIPEC